MSTPNAPIPAGWYPDPAGSFQQRWWTGTSWTNDFAQYRPTLIHSAPIGNNQPYVNDPIAHIQQTVPGATSGRVSPPGILAAMGGQQAAQSTNPPQTPTETYAPSTYGQAQTLVADSPVTAPVAFQLPAADQPPQTTVAQPNAGSATLIPVAQPPLTAFRAVAETPGFGTEYQPFGYKPEVRVGGVRERPQVRYTVWVWLLVALPFVMVGLGFVAATALPLFYTAFTQLLLLGVTLLLSVGLAVADRHALYLEGHDHRAAAILALLTPLPYLLARAIIVTRETERSAILPPIIQFAGIALGLPVLLFVPGLMSLLFTASAL